MMINAVCIVKGLYAKWASVITDPSPFFDMLLSD